VASVARFFLIFRNFRKMGGERGGEGVSIKVRILTPISGRFTRSRRLSLDSAKTYEYPARGTACRNTDEFPLPVTAALIGRFTAIPEKA
jgi:hypothetical protein